MMNGKAIVQIPTKPASTSKVGGILQRCTATTECSDCRKKREGLLQRVAVNNTPTHEVPPIVHEVLRSSGKPLDPVTRAYMEPRFGHDFSQVRVHTNARAAESAQAVNALAYTVDRDIAFGAGRFTPETVDGKRILAHELTHVVQQQGNNQLNARSLTIGEVGGVFEREAEIVAKHVTTSQRTMLIKKKSDSTTLRRLGDTTKVPLGMSCPVAVDTPANVIEELTFRSAVSKLNPMQKAVIAAFVTSWHALGESTDIRVDGYASEPGRDEFNWRLSCDRAEAVAAELMTPSSGTAASVSGVPVTQIDIFAHGETDEFSSTGRGTDRRSTISSPVPLPPTPSPHPPLCPAIPTTTPGTCTARHTAYCAAASCFPSNPWLDCVCIASGQVCDAVEAFTFSGTTGTALASCTFASGSSGGPIMSKGRWFNSTNRCIWGHWRAAFEALHDPSRPVPSTLTPEWVSAITICRSKGIGSRDCCQAQVNAEQKAIDRCGPYDSKRFGTLPTNVPGAPICSAIVEAAAPPPSFTGDFGNVTDRITYGNRRCCP